MKKLGLGVGVIVLAIAAWLLLGHERSGASDHATGSGSATASSKLDRAKPSVPAQVSGTVMDADKHTPIAGAVVALANNGAIGGELGVKKPTLTAISDANGVWSAASVPPGAYVITASAINYLPTTITGKVVVASGEPMSGVAIVLHAGGTLVHGTVTDIGGGVIEGAHVRFVDEERFVLSAGEYLAITGKDGTYQISMPEGRWGGQASHEDYVARSEQVEVADKPVKLDFQLIPGGGVRGEVIARDTGKPVPGAMVAAKPQRERFGNNLPNTAADADGVFAIHGLSSGVVALTAFGRGYASAEPTTVELGIGEQLEHVRVLVDRAYTISGTVTAKGTQTGVAGISLGVFSMAQGAQIVAPNPTDDRGRFAIDGVKPGSYMLFAIGEGSVPNIGKQVQVVDKDVEVDLELERGVTLSGHVEPPQAAVMSIEMQGQVGLANMFEAVKTMMVSGDANAQTGEFTLHNVPGGAFKLVAHGKAGPTGELPIVVTDHDQSGLVVKLDDRGTISGRVIDTTGQPVAEMTVSAKRTDDDHEASMFTMSGPRRDNVTTGPDGTYKLVGLEAGTYEMHARHPQDWSEDFESIEKTDKKKKVEVAVVVGQEKSGVTITVEARNGVIKGVVIGSDKNPAADAWVTAKRVPAKPTVAKPSDGKDDDADVQNQDWWPESEPVLTGPDGKFTIGKLRDGTYVVVADGPHGGSRAEKKDVKPGDTIQITLAPLATITGRVTSAGAPVNPYSIECTGATQIERSVAAADGAYKLEHVAPGSYTCSISSDAGTASDKLDVPAGDVTHDFALTPWASITGTVVSMFDKSPVPGLNALIAGQSSDGGMADLIAGGGNKTDATGHFTIPKAPVGKGNLLIMDATSGFKPLATKDYTITTGQRVDVGAIEVVPPRKGEAGTFGLVAEITGVTGPKDLDQAKLAVTQVKPGGPAANAGILVGDVITTIGDKTVGTLGAVNAQNYLSSGSIGIGVTVTLGIDRAGQKLAVQITSVKW